MSVPPSVWATPIRRCVTVAPPHQPDCDMPVLEVRGLRQLRVQPRESRGGSDPAEPPNAAR